uniref:Hypothetical secreted peptide n=1 Tax=Rhipicephalus sanguineus TaxID=34632 RepID=C9W1G6_RHISA
MSRFSTLTIALLAIVLTILSGNFESAAGRRAAASSMCTGHCVLQQNGAFSGCPVDGNCTCTEVDRTNHWPKNGTCRDKVAHTGP